MRKKKPPHEPPGCGHGHKEAAFFGWKLDPPLQKQRKTIAAYFGWILEAAVLKPTKGHMPLELTLTNEQKQRVTLKPVTATGKPAKLDTKVPVLWEVLNGAGTFVVDSPDGMAAFLVTSDDDLSDTLFQVSADADVGDGVTTLMDTVLLHTTGAMAASLGLASEPPVPK